MTELYIRNFELEVQGDDDNTALQLVHQVLRHCEHKHDIFMDEVLCRKAAFFAQLRAFMIECSQNRLCEVLRDTIHPYALENEEFDNERKVLLKVYKKDTALEPSPFTLRSLLPLTVKMESASYKQLHDLVVFALSDRGTRLASMKPDEMVSFRTSTKKRIKKLRAMDPLAEGLVSIVID